MTEANRSTSAPTPPLLVEETKKLTECDCNYEERRAGQWPNVFARHANWCNSEKPAHRLLRSCLALLDQQREAIETLEQEQWPPTDAREYRRRTGIEVDNHHNALTCPYCNPERLGLTHPKRLEELTAKVGTLEQERSEAVQARILAESQRHYTEAKVETLEQEKAKEPTQGWELLPKTLRRCADALEQFEDGPANPAVSRGSSIVVMHEAANTIEALGAALARLQQEPASMISELRTYLDTLIITGATIGDIRRSLFVPWDSKWNGIVRDETAAREGPGASPVLHTSEETT